MKALSAKQARKLAKSGAALAEAKKRDAARHESERIKKACLAAVKDDVPKYIDTISVRIEAAAKRGSTSTDFRLDTKKETTTAIMDSLADHFRGLEYQTTISYRKEDVDHGDSAAPCVETIYETILTVDWEHS